MGAKFILGLLSGDGYQVFAALPGEYATEAAAVRAAREDYLARFGGSPVFRVYQLVSEAPGPRPTLIEVCFDETKQRSFVALYKVIEASRPESLRPIRRPAIPFRDRVAALLARFFPGPSPVSVVLCPR